MQSSNSVEIAPSHTAPDRRVPRRRDRRAARAAPASRYPENVVESLVARRNGTRSQQGALLTRNRSLLLLLVVTILATALVASASGAKTMKLSATLNGKQEVAKQTTASSARGSFSATLSG